MVTLEGFENGGRGAGGHLPLSKAGFTSSGPQRTPKTQLFIYSHSSESTKYSQQETPSPIATHYDVFFIQNLCLHFFPANIDNINVTPPPILLCRTCAPQPEVSIDTIITDNIVRFMNNKKKGGPDSFVNKVMKHAVLTAVTFSQPKERRDAIRSRLGLSKHYEFL